MLENARVLCGRRGVVTRRFYNVTKKEVLKL